MEKYERKQFDVIVTGGGMAGICAALAAARHGARTALVHNRPVLGGNASSEIRMHICGASVHGKRQNARETGILEELLLENKRRNPQFSFSVWDTVLWEKVRFQENLTLYLNTQVIEVFAQRGHISGLQAYQATTEKSYEFTAKIYMDCTGDGMIAFRAGAETRMGRESRGEYQESFAPLSPDGRTMGATLMFCANDTGKPCPFEKPGWAYDISEEQLAGRQHTAASEEPAGVDSGYWWLELGGTQDVIRDSEEIRDELLKTLYGVWDHMKNTPGHGTETYALDWVQFLPGRRESRRVIGDHVLCQQELTDPAPCADTAAYGGWPMDMHPPEGFLYRGPATEYIHLKQVYPIPYRCYYSRSVDNLMMAGRCISATHTAFGSVRVMGTCAVGGQAAGTAAALAVRNNCTPRQVGENIELLQQMLLRDDCYLPGIKNSSRSDLARGAKASASSYEEGWEPGHVINGTARPEGEASNGWRSAPFTRGEPWLRLDFMQRKLGEIQLTFDSGLSEEIMITLSKTLQKKQHSGLPAALVKDYTLELLLDEKPVYRLSVNGNGQRLRRHRLTEGIEADAVVLRVHGCRGAQAATVFEMRVYPFTAVEEGGVEADE